MYWSKQFYVLPRWHGEVYEGDIGGELRGVVWIRELGGDVHFEVFMVRYDRITQLQNCAPLLLKCLITKRQKDLTEHSVEDVYFKYCYLVQ